MKIFNFSLIVLLSFSFQSLQASYTVKEGKLVNQKDLSTLSVQEHYSILTESHRKKDWSDVLKQAAIIIKNFPSTPFAQEARFYLGVGYFHLNDYELANKSLSNYLKKQTTPKHFEEAIEYKFTIAEKFKKGAKKHVMGLKSMPQWIPAKEDALAIYEEVIIALPHHDLAARALFGKAKLLVEVEDYKESIEAFQTLIRRFPKHALAIESYIEIAQVYLTQCQNEYPDPDFLDLAEINFKKFQRDFPIEERLVEAGKVVKEMQEIYAHSLYETGKFFERTKKQQAASLYYTKVISKYPETKVANLARERLEKFENRLKKEEEISDKNLSEETALPVVENEIVGQ